MCYEEVIASDAEAEVLLGLDQKVSLLESGRSFHTVSIKKQSFSAQLTQPYHRVSVSRLSNTHRKSGGL